MTHRAGRHFLQLPGPSETPGRILRALSRPVIDHRGPEFNALAARVLQGVKSIFKTDQTAFIYPSSACLAVRPRTLLIAFRVSGDWLRVWALTILSEAKL